MVKKTETVESPAAAEITKDIIAAALKYGALLGTSEKKLAKLIKNHPIKSLGIALAISYGIKKFFKY